MPSEFSLIQRYFTRPVRHTALGVGDDCALLAPAPGMALAVSVDMLVAGRHFLPDTDAARLGHKALAVNLSDCAAMGAQPRWATLALALPAADEAWLAAFAQGFFALADQFKIDLVGGDTTRGPLNICIQIMGEVPQGQALRRDGARPGDDIWVSGTLGDAALALAHVQQRFCLDASALAALLPRLEAPTPRVALGLALRDLAHSAIDLSDGLLADLGHILERSGCGADIEFAALPVSAALRTYLDQDLVRDCVLAGGDDYELCFTAPAAARPAIAALAAPLGLPLTCIGRITAAGGLRLLDADQHPMPVKVTGFDHFQ
jgi:thiamine-monophosphate kinase